MHISCTLPKNAAEPPSQLLVSQRQHCRCESNTLKIHQNLELNQALPSTARDCGRCWRGGRRSYVFRLVSLWRKCCGNGRGCRGFYYRWCDRNRRWCSDVWSRMEIAKHFSVLFRFHPFQFISLCTQLCLQFRDMISIRFSRSLRLSESQ